MPIGRSSYIPTTQPSKEKQEKGPKVVFSFVLPCFVVVLCYGFLCCLFFVLLLVLVLLSCPCLVCCLVLCCLWSRFCLFLVSSRRVFCCGCVLLLLLSCLVLSCDSSELVPDLSCRIRSRSLNLCLTCLVVSEVAVETVAAAVTGVCTSIHQYVCLVLSCSVLSCLSVLSVHPSA
jgi:hypothetical protein